MGSSCSSSSKYNRNKDEGSKVNNDPSNFKMIDLLEKSTILHAKIERHIFSSKPPQKDESNQKEEYIQNKVNDAEYQKRLNIFKCPNQHDLTCNTPYKCVICPFEKVGLACQICRYHICYDCFGINIINCLFSEFN